MESIEKILNTMDLSITLTAQTGIHLSMLEERWFLEVKEIFIDSIGYE